MGAGYGDGGLEADIMIYTEYTVLVLAEFDWVSLLW